MIEHKLLRMESAADPPPRDWERTVEQMEPGGAGAVEPSAGPPAGEAIPGPAELGAAGRVAAIAANADSGGNGSSENTGTSENNGAARFEDAGPVSAGVASGAAEQPEHSAATVVAAQVVSPGFASPSGLPSASAPTPAPPAVPAPPATPQPTPQAQPQGAASYPPYQPYPANYPAQYPGAAPQWGQPQQPYAAGPYQAHAQAYAHAQYMAQMQQAQAYAQAQAQQGQALQGQALQVQYGAAAQHDQAAGALPPQPAGPPGAPGAAQGSEAAVRPPITPRRAFLELGAVYVPSFGLGIVNAVGLLRYTQLSHITEISPWFDALSDIFSYAMQAMVVIFGVGYFSMRRGWTLRALFGMPTPPDPYPMVPGPGWAGYPGQPAAYAYQQPRRPGQRGVGWQYARVYFMSLLGVFLFLAAVLIFDAITHETSGAPSQGGGAWLIPDGIVTSLAAGFGEEVLITGMLVTTLEQAGFGRRPWLIYLVAVCLRIPFHLYYGWAAFGVITFTLMNVWVYRRWRLLWPIVLAHATYDALQFLGELNAGLAGLAIVLTALATIVMGIVILCIEVSDASARRDFARAQSVPAMAGGWAPGYPPPGAPPQAQGPKHR